MRAETPFDFFHVISVGKGTSAMPAWGDVLLAAGALGPGQLSVDRRPGTGKLAEGQGVYLSPCAGCHGRRGDGQGAYSAGLLQPVPPLDEPQPLARKSDADLFAAVAHGVPGTAMPGFARR